MCEFGITGLLFRISGYLRASRALNPESQKLKGSKPKAEIRSTKIQGTREFGLWARGRLSREASMPPATTQRSPYPLIKEYTVNNNMKPPTI